MSTPRSRTTQGGKKRAFKEVDYDSTEGLAWDSKEAQEAAAVVDLDLAFHRLNQSSTQDSGPEHQLIAKLRKELPHVFGHIGGFVLEPFGSFVTDLGLPRESGRSDLDVVMLFRHHRADSKEAKEVRNNLVMPTIDQLGRWLRLQKGINVKNIIRHARVPIVMFETKDLEVDISVQQPFGALNSWHLRDLCRSGVPGRLRALIRLVKQWAKSKAIHSAKDGALSSYGWAMLAAGFLQECGLLPALLDSERSYMTADDALWYVLNAVNQRPENLWLEPQLYSVDGNSPMEAHQRPCELFFSWLQWLQSTALHPCGTYNFGSLPLHQRHIVSVRGATQEELQLATAECSKADHWDPLSNPVFMLIEEPFTGENVARSVREDALRDIVSELQRALEIMASMDAEEAFEELLQLPPLRQRKGAPNGVGLGKGAGKGSAGAEPPKKRPKLPEWSPWQQPAHSHNTRHAESWQGWRSHNR